jgi:putative ABC transport system permease protein
MSILSTTSTLFRQTGANLWRHKLRSFLTMFGIAWGIASLVLMSALCDGFRSGQRNNMKQIGDSIVMVWGGRTERQAGGERAGRWISLYQKDVEIIREQCPLVETVAGEIKREGFASSEFNSGRFMTLGVTPEYLQLRTFPVTKGRSIDAADVQEGRRVCVLGNSVRKQLFEERPDVLGRRVMIKGSPYVVIGLLSDKNQNSSYDGWDNEKILIPQTSLLRDCPPTDSWWRPGQLATMIYRPASIKEWKAAETQVRRTLGRVHDFDPLDEAATPMWDTLEGAELFDKAFDATEIFLAVISLITLSLGGVGVMNTMMSSVAERTSEIGLRKALGATRRRILTEFFLEGSMIALLSGAMGLAGIWLLSTAINSLPLPEMFAGLPIRFSTGLAALAALGATAIAASMPPAWRAANLTPVEALREER